MNGPVRATSKTNSYPIQGQTESNVRPALDTRVPTGVGRAGQQRYRRAVRPSSRHDPTSPAATLLAGTRGLSIVDQDAPLDPVVDAALGTALVRHLAAAQEVGQGLLRWYRPLPTLAFTGRDLRLPGRAEALRVAALHGFTPIRRPQGGHAAALHRGSLCFDLVLPDPDPGTSAVGRLAALGSLWVDVLRAVGADARLGPVPDEYCPGDYSVNARGDVKLLGTAARRIRGAVLLSGVVLVDDPTPVRAVVDDVYRALAMACDIHTVGALSEEVPGVTPAQVTAVLEDALVEHLSLDRVETPAPALEAAMNAPNELD